MTLLAAEYSLMNGSEVESPDLARKVAFSVSVDGAGPSDGRPRGGAGDKVMTD
jgi:hypothetical protein